MRFFSQNCFLFFLWNTLIETKQLHNNIIFKVYSDSDRIFFCLEFSKLLSACLAENFGQIVQLTSLQLQKFLQNKSAKLELDVVKTPHM